MPAECQGNHGHDEQADGAPSRAIGRQEAEHEQQRHHQRSQIQLVFVWQRQRLGADFAIELAKGHYRACERYRADEDAQIHFHHVDGVHVGRHFAWLDVAVIAHQHGGQAHETVQNGNQLGHLCHFDFAGAVYAYGRTNDHGDEYPHQALGIGAKHRDKQGNAHAHHAKHIAAFGGFLFGQTCQTENKQDGRNDVSGANKS